MSVFRLLGALALLVACGPSANNETLQQAADIHNEAIEIGHRTSLLVSQLKQLEDTLSSGQKDSLQIVIRALSEWYETVVEVPGFDHEDRDHHDHSGHDHDHHDHDHGDEKNYLEGLPPEEVLQVQQALKVEVERIEGQVVFLAKSIRSQGQAE